MLTNNTSNINVRITTQHQIKKKRKTRQMAKLTLKALLTKIQADTAANGFSLIGADAKELATKLLAEKKIEQNTAYSDAAGNMQVRYITPAPAEAPAKPKFEIAAGVPVINGVRGGVREEVYPFSQLEVGQSFVVPVDADKPTPKDVVEKFSSTVSSATRRYAVASETETRTNKKGETVPVLKQTRKFTLRPVTKGQTYPGSSFVESQDGARVYRTA